MSNRSRSSNRSLNPCLRKRENEKDYDYENDSLFPADTQLIELRLTGDEKVLSFDYALNSGEWTSLVTKTDSYPISVQAAGGGLHFTGALVGVHARTE